MAVEGIVLEKAREESKDVALKHRHDHQTPKAAENVVVETPRASSVSTPKSSVPSSAKSTPARMREKPTKYVSQMAKAREEKQRQAAATARDQNNTSSSSDMETSSNPSTESSTSVHSDMSKKSGIEDKLGNLPKFGEWDRHSVNSGPCYTLLFQNAAQEKKIGGPIRVHASRPSDQPAQNEDLYGYNRDASVKKPGRKTKQCSLLCCFTSSESS